MLKKEEVNVSPFSAYKLLHPMHTMLVLCIGKNGKPNTITSAWAMPTSINPPLVAISIAPKRHSHALLKKQRSLQLTSQQ
jgi:flavin reductase (DIM6/NTAB) family NADH-FMN oxidoreductase RutF